MTEINDLITTPNNWDLFVALCEPMIDLPAIFRVTNVKIKDNYIYLSTDIAFVYHMLCSQNLIIAQFLKIFYYNECYGLKIYYESGEKNGSCWQEIEYKKIARLKLAMK